MPVISTSEFRNGSKVELNGEPFTIVEFQHVKPGKGGAFVRTKLKSLRTGNVIERTYRSGEKLDTPDLDEKDMKFLYAAGEEYTFMDTTSYEQLTFSRKELGDGWDLLKEDMTVTILLHNTVPIGMELPVFVELRVVKTDPGVRGDTASGGSKPAVLESGATIKVPLYLDEGVIVRVDSRTREFVERA
jgi:elongation factor P